jgi:hypothetical protein
MRAMVVGMSNLPPTTPDQKVFTTEQMAQLLALCARIQARAVERGTEQSVTIVFNGKGYPRHLNGTDNENAIVPKMYRAE